MLDISQAIRIEQKRYGKRNDSYKLYIFRCSYNGCDREIRLEKKRLKNSRGLCRRHAAANLSKPFMGLYNQIMYSVNATNKKRDRNCEFHLTYDEFIFLTQIGVCYYCGEPNIKWNPFVGNGQYRSNLDRKDNTKGYSFDNVVVCCKDCNFMKRDWFSCEEFKALRLLLKRLREGTQEDREELMYMLSSWNNDVRILL